MHNHQYSYRSHPTDGGLHIFNRPWNRPWSAASLLSESLARMPASSWSDTRSSEAGVGLTDGFSMSECSSSVFRFLAWKNFWVSKHAWLQTEQSEFALLRLRLLASATQSLAVRTTAFLFWGWRWFWFFRLRLLWLDPFPVRRLFCSRLLKQRKVSFSA